jgi:hypothetical protein
LRSRYQVNFALQMNAKTCLDNYEYLDILDGAWREWSGPRPSGGLLCDIGCASFWYAATLHAFFHPDRMLGIEIEGYRLFRDGRSRIDYAAGYVQNCPNTEFIVADYANFRQPADVITAWFPFLTPVPVLAWRLPLSLLAPDRMFASVKHNLNPDGWFVMVNHGLREAALAESLCTAAGLSLTARWAEMGPLSAHRSHPPVISAWRHAGATHFFGVR